VGKENIQSRTLKKFNGFDIIRVFILIGQKKLVKRGYISHSTSIGEGSVKSILNILSKKNLVKITKKGNMLTRKGEKFYKRITDVLSNIKLVKQDIFKDGFKAYGAILKEYEKEKIKYLYKARDYAIRLGCWSAMVLIRTSNSIIIPYIRKYNFNSLRKEFDTKVGDLIIIVSSENRRKTEKGILSIARYLNSKLSKIFCYLEK